MLRHISRTWPDRSHSRVIGGAKIGHLRPDSLSVAHFLDDAPRIGVHCSRRVMPFNIWSRSTLKQRRRAARAKQTADRMRRSAAAALQLRDPATGCFLPKGERVYRAGARSPDRTVLCAGRSAGRSGAVRCRIETGGSVARAHRGARRARADASDRRRAPGRVSLASAKSVGVRRDRRRPGGV